MSSFLLLTQLARKTSAGDLEIHSFAKTAYFMIDLARSFPAHCPKISASFLAGRIEPSGQVFFRLFRPEFLRILKVDHKGLVDGKMIDGISSDVFSLWGKTDAEKYDGDASHATRFLLETHCQRVAEAIDSKFVQDFSLSAL